MNIYGLGTQCENYSSTAFFYFTVYFSPPLPPPPCPPPWLPPPPKSLTLSLLLFLLPSLGQWSTNTTDSALCCSKKKAIIYIRDDFKCHWHWNGSDVFGLLLFYLFDLSEVDLSCCWTYDYTFSYDTLRTDSSPLRMQLNFPPNVFPRQWDFPSTVSVLKLNFLPAVLRGKRVDMICLLEIGCFPLMNNISRALCQER